MIRKILVIRLQAAGDFFVTLPYIQDLKRKMPAGTIIDLIIREEYADIPKTFNLFDSIYILRGKRNTKKQLLWFFLMWPKLFFKKYDVVLDLQNHRLSAVMRFWLFVKAFSVLDRTSTDYAGDRFKNTINALEIAEVKFSYLDSLKNVNKDLLFEKSGLKAGEKYVLINPAGAFENRNWEKEKYVQFCKLWLQKVEPDAKFIVLGISKIKEKTDYFNQELGEKLIDLVNKTTLTEAIHIIKNLHLTISEDSGLMHMSYSLGVPTIGILGSTRNDWTNPNLPNTYFFNSSDLECGNCMLEKCRFAEIKCLTRITPENVLNAAVELLGKQSKK
ncbi:MAG: glycosyltransferase family 9 protein [Bacteroidia bacterium]|nr:glycosyltransferase family 9 protein [Bacteroidia bacterium]